MSLAVGLPEDVVERLHLLRGEAQALLDVRIEPPLLVVARASHGGMAAQERHQHFGLRGHLITPLRTAYSTISAALWRSSFSMMRARWVSTVLGLMNSIAAISLLVFPSATSWKISRSRSDSDSKRSTAFSPRWCA